MKAGWLLPLLAVVGCVPLFGQGILFTLMTNGPTANRLNVVFLSEGYTNSQAGKFTNDACAMLADMVATPPFSQYTNYLNAFAIFVASAQAGSDHPSSNVLRNTYFNSSYDSYGLARLITIPPNDRDGTYANGQGKVVALLQSLLPTYDLAVLIVNDPDYGGSGGSTLIASVHASSPEIGLHEMGHTLSALGDEYTSAYPGYPDTEEPNTTVQTNRALIKWKPWILTNTPVPTPDTSAYTNVVGLFQGAHYHTNGWYRPKHSCKMRSLNVPYCEVCSETLVRSIYNLVDPIDGAAPPTNSMVFLTNSAVATLSVVALQPTTQQLDVQWFVNGSPRAGATNPALTLYAWDLPLGTNSVRAEVSDPTPLVRTDTQNLLRNTRTWRVKSTLELPRLAIRQSSDQVLVSWSAEAAGFQLESTATLRTGTTWTTHGILAGGTNAGFALTNTQRFLRLRLP
jgi:hypothetical protein